ncbi:hypothetical protein [Arundinibacter roseus]|uniref:DUF3592 domain-containing protein n=1 Tax=Arundinibacter roseus TaxID=2070510 RepID=A0A4R4KHA0_9BACT|nr:hypothetical protein [Arundinibacter roseus]TDB67454.1 hypothetical protein EZE20_05775 [Arundinibacter roseus]
MKGVPKENKTEFEWAMFFQIWGFALIALPALYFSISSARDRKQIVDNQAYAAATVVKIKSINKGRGSVPHLRFYYSFSYKNQVMQDAADYKYQRYFVDFSEDKWAFVVGKQFPVLFSSKDPTTHHVLFFRSDFAKYSLAFPDSLAWSEKVFYSK